LKEYFGLSSIPVAVLIGINANKATYKLIQVDEVVRLQHSAYTEITKHISIVLLQRCISKSIPSSFISHIP